MVWIIGFIDLLYTALGTTGNYCSPKPTNHYTLNVLQPAESSIAVSW
jgi:hypothetical protein